MKGCFCSDVTSDPVPYFPLLWKSGKNTDFLATTETDQENPLITGRISQLPKASATLVDETTTKSILNIFNFVLRAASQGNTELHYKIMNGNLSHFRPPSPAFPPPLACTGQEPAPFQVTQSLGKRVRTPLTRLLRSALC